MRVAASASPIRTNSGTTVRTKLLDWVKAILAICRMACGDTKMKVPAMPIRPSATATGVRVASNATSARMKAAKPANEAILHSTSGRGGCEFHSPGT